MNWNGFANLDLSGVEADDFTPMTVGEHRVKATSAEVATADNNRDKRVVVQFEDVDTGSRITHGFNVFHSSEKAMEIGLRQLKAFLEHGGHPNPNNPGDISTLVGLKCGVYVDYGKPFTGRDGQERTRLEIKRFFDFDDRDPAKQAPSANGAAAGPGAALDDEIPF